MTEGVPPDALDDASTFSSRLKIPLQNSIEPDGLSAFLPQTGENPICGLAERRALFPQPQVLCHRWFQGNIESAEISEPLIWTIA